MTGDQPNIRSDSPLNYPVCADSALVVDRHYRDFEQQSERLSGHDQNYFQLSKGQYQGRFLSAILGAKVSFHFEFANQRLQQFVGFPTDLISLGLVFSNLEPFQVNGMQLDTGDVMICKPGGEMNMISPPGGAVMAVCFSRAELENHPSGIGLLTMVDGLQDNVNIYNLPSLANRLREDALAAIESAQLIGTTRDETMCAATETAALHCMLGQLELHLLQSKQAEIGTITTGYATYRKMHDALIARCDTPLDYQKMSRATGLSRRSLQVAFASYLDMTPTQYSRALRLNMARRMIVQGLSAPETIGDIAQSSGFFGWSRFTQHYAELFGELPSETRKRFEH